MRLKEMEGSDVFFSDALMERPRMARCRDEEVKGKKDSDQDDADARKFRMFHCGTDDDILRYG